MLYSATVFGRDVLKMINCILMLRKQITVPRFCLTSSFADTAYTTHITIPILAYQQNKDSYIFAFYIHFIKPHQSNKGKEAESCSKEAFENFPRILVTTLLH
jgi:hypothetical protein